MYIYICVCIYLFSLLHGTLSSIKFNVYFCVFYVFLACSVSFTLFCFVLDFSRIFFLFHFSSVSLKFSHIFYSLCGYHRNYPCFLFFRSTKRPQHYLASFISFITDMLLLLDTLVVYFYRYEILLLCMQSVFI